MVGTGAVIAVAAGAATFSFAERSGTSHPGAILQPAASPASPALPDGRSANFWYVQNHQYLFESKNGAPVKVDAGIQDDWYGHDRPSIAATGTDNTDPVLRSAYAAKGNQSYGEPSSWDEEWTAPTDQASVLTVLRSHDDDSDNVAFSNGQQLMVRPGPQTYRQAIVDAMAALADVTVSHGVDAEGVPTETLTHTSPQDGGSTAMVVNTATAGASECSQVRPIDLPPLDHHSSALLSRTRCPTATAATPESSSAVRASTAKLIFSVIDPASSSFR